MIYFVFSRVLMHHREEEDEKEEEEEEAGVGVLLS